MAEPLPWHRDPNRRVCRNPKCVQGREKVMVLMDNPQELRLLAEHFPNRKPHVHEAWVPCKFCCGPRLHQAGLDRLRSQSDRDSSGDEKHG